jgi:glycosyltransferase involved in cell wall biosynthesis
MPAGNSRRPLVSTILTTRDRPRFVSIALRCYGHQDYAERELIVVDDGEHYPVDENAVAAAGGRLVRLPSGTTLGAKLNAGVQRANGLWCQKMDDDDWYAPTFLSTMVSAVEGGRENVCRPSLAMLAPFLFFEVARWEIRRSGERAAPGATLIFAREDWEEKPFRGVRRDEDVWFVRDQVRLGRQVIPVKALESFLAVRHTGSLQDRGHTWTHEGNRGALEEAVRERPLHERKPEDLLPDWALAVYRPLQLELNAALAK